MVCSDCRLSFLSTFSPSQGGSGRVQMPAHLKTEDPLLHELPARKLPVQELPEQEPSTTCLDGMSSGLVQHELQLDARFVKSKNLDCISNDDIVDSCNSNKVIDEIVPHSSIQADSIRCSGHSRVKLEFDRYPYTYVRNYTHLYYICGFLFDLQVLRKLFLNYNL